MECCKDTALSSVQYPPGIIGQNVKQLRQRINDIYVTSTSDFGSQLATAKRLIEEG